MKTIEIKSLKLINFKGIRSLEINDISKQTFIYGDNGIGKTTVFDAFTWLLFGKDSSDRKVFEVKTLDADNNVIPKIEHSVEALLEVNGMPVELKRILREKWVTRRGSTETEFKGNDTVYEWNGVPMNAGEYTSKINSIIDESVFKLITNPASFNSMPWKDQRDVLIDMSGNFTDMDVASGNPEFETLVANCADKTLDEYKKQLRAIISKSKKELDSIPTRIDEVERSKPEAFDFSALKVQLDEKNNEIQDVQELISDKLKAQQADIEEQRKTQNRIHVIDTEINQIKHDLRQKATSAYNDALEEPRKIQRRIDAIDADIRANDTTIANSKSRVSSYKGQIASIEKSISDLRRQWDTENAKEFKMDEGECACPTCKRPFDASVIEEKQNDLKEHFISNKNARLKSINDRGKELSGQKSTLESNVAELSGTFETKEAENTQLWKDRAELSEQLKAFSNEKSQTDFYNELLAENNAVIEGKQNEIDSLKGELGNREQVDTSDLKHKLETLNSQRDAIKSKLALEDRIKGCDTRIAELMKEESTLSQGIAAQEREMYVIEAFEKEKSTRIENSVNDRFQLVRFKLFETQINGGEVPTCKALIDGVPFSDANTASKINAGLDIINTLCGHYQVNAPIFIDNRESVVELIHTESQLVNLIVSEEDKKLRISDRPMSYADEVFKEKMETETV